MHLSIDMDTMVWKDNKDVTFSVKSMHSIIARRRIGSAVQKIIPVKKVWNVGVHARVSLSFFICEVDKGVVLTRS